MATILLTGATGTLGRELIPRLLRAGHDVRAMTSRSPAPAARQGLTWVRADLSDGAGLTTAVAGASTVLHCASSPVRRTRQVDADGTARLLQAAQRAAVSHFVYPSIVGSDRADYPLYRSKLRAEEHVAASGLPYSILRATKFHAFLDLLLRVADRLPLLLLPTDFKDQPIDEGEVATALVSALERAPGGRLADLAGPEVLDYRQLAMRWLAARGRSKPVVHVPLPGKVAAAFRSGATPAPDAARGVLTWGEWLQRTYSARGAATD